MPDDLKACPPGVWTLLTDEDVVGATIGVRGADVSPLLIKATAGAVEPVDEKGAFPFRAGQKQQIDDIATVWKGVGGPSRLYAMPEGQATMLVAISYA